MDGHGAGDKIESGSAVFLRNGDVVNSGIYHLLVQFPVKTVLIHPLISGGNLVFCEVAEHFPQHQLLFRPIKYHIVQNSFFENSSVLTIDLV